MKKGLTPLILLALSKMAPAASIDDFKYRHYCPVAARSFQVADLNGYLAENNLVIKNTPYDPEFLNQFLNEYQKFPEDLRAMMLQTGAVIHLIQGNGVTDDPTWSAGAYTFDGRAWSAVPGAGGTPWLKERGPTRIVMNSLYRNHGSTNLFLHEHGHSLDSMIQGKQVSQREDWKAIAANPDTKKFLAVICGSYCVDNINEGFAELFAYYNACATTKRDMETYLPQAVNYLEDLPTLLHSMMRPAPVIAPEPIPVSVPEVTKKPETVPTVVKPQVEAPRRKWLRWFPRS